MIDPFKDFAQAWVRVVTDAMRLTDKDSGIKSRLKICSKCGDRKLSVCGKCGCPLIAKVRSKNGCPIKKW